MTILLQSLDDLEFVLRRDTRIDGDVFDHGLEFINGHFYQHLAGEYVIILGDAQFMGDVQSGEGWSPVIITGRTPRCG